MLEGYVRDFYFGSRRPAGIDWHRHHRKVKMPSVHNMFKVAAVTFGAVCVGVTFGLLPGACDAVANFVTSQSPLVNLIYAGVVAELCVAAAATAKVLQMDKKPAPYRSPLKYNDWAFPTNTNRYAFS